MDANDQARLAAIVRDLYHLVDNLENMNSADVWSQLDSMATAAYLVAVNAGIPEENLNQET